MQTVFTDLIRRVRQHHAIEHATLHMLTNQFPGQRFGGYSDPLGFTIYADIDEYTLRRAVGDALLRLQAGEHSLAIHPNCGTNMVTIGVLVALVAVITSSRRNILERFIFTLFGVLPILVYGRSLGMHFQNYTTSNNVSDRWVAEIRPISVGGVQAFRVLFE